MKKCLFFIILLIGICLASDGRLPEKFHGGWVNIKDSLDRIDFINDGQFYYGYNYFIAPGRWVVWDIDSLYYCFHYEKLDTATNKVVLVIVQYVGNYKIFNGILYIRMMNVYNGHIRFYYYKRRERK